MSQGGRLVSCDTDSGDDGGVEGCRLSGIFDLSVDFGFSGELRPYFGRSLKSSYFTSAE